MAEEKAKGKPGPKPKAKPGVVPDAPEGYSKDQVIGFREYPDQYVFVTFDGKKHQVEKTAAPPAPPQGDGNQEGGNDDAPAGSPEGKE